MLPWNQERQRLQQEKEEGFNGATALLPWNQDTLRQLANGPLLQWGHGIAAVESTFRRASRSMNMTLQWGHGIAAVESVKERIEMAIKLMELQWGHGIAAVESRAHRGCGRGGRGFNGATALLPWNHADLGRPRARARGASMGPRHCCRGISDRARAEGDGPGRGFNGATALLPWNRVDSFMGKILNWLQWGHGIAAVESGIHVQRETQGPGCFNGATALLPWNPSVNETVSANRFCFNGATALLPWNPCTCSPT